YQRGSVVGCMDMILWLFDNSGCSMVVMATPTFERSPREGEFQEYLKQFDRRGIYRLVLESEPDRADLDLIASRHGLKPAEEEAEAIMLDIAHKDGFGKFCTRLEDAVELAEKDRKSDV